jgi:putative flippase GtrA
MTGRVSQPLAPMVARFVTVGGLSVGCDLLALYTLRSVVHLPLLLATAIGYAVSLVVNYTLNHGWVFGAEADHRRRVARYSTLVIVNVASTFGFVAGLSAAGLYYLFAKLVAVAVNAVINFLAFRHWVFR